MSLITVALLVHLAVGQAPERWSAAHEIRHSQQVADWMGHASVVTTPTIYTHLFIKYDTDVVRKLRGARSAARTELPANVVRPSELDRDAQSRGRCCGGSGHVLD